MSSDLQQQSGRKRAQAFFHQFDWYANPVTLTYNQKKSFTTVPGAICSIISGVLLIYYVCANIAVFWSSDGWIQSKRSQTLDTANPQSYLIES